MKSFNIFAENHEGIRLFNLGIAHRDEEWVREEVLRLNCLDHVCDVVYGYEEV